MSVFISRMKHEKQVCMRMEGKIQSERLKLREAGTGADEFIDFSILFTEEINGAV